MATRECHRADVGGLMAPVDGRVLWRRLLLDKRPRPDHTLMKPPFPHGSLSRSGRSQELLEKPPIDRIWRRQELMASLCRADPAFRAGEDAGLSGRCGRSQVLRVVRIAAECCRLH